MVVFVCFFGLEQLSYYFFVFDGLYWVCLSLKKEGWFEIEMLDVLKVE